VNSDTLNGIDGIAQRALETARDLQPWPGYFEARAREFKTIAHFSRFDGAGRILEIGCGNGFTASLLSLFSPRVVALDLPSKNPVSHSLGIDTAAQLMRRTQSRRVRLVGASAEELPFPDRSFDLVFSEYVLQYVRDKDRVLEEVHRVLRDGGKVVTLVPNFMERLFSPCAKYEYLIGRGFSYILERVMQKQRREAESAGIGVPDRARADGRRRFRDLLLLRPDGAYGSFVEEVVRSTPYAWRDLLARNGFRVQSTFSTELFPLGLFTLCDSSFKIYMTKKASRVSGLIGNLPLIRDIGHTLGLVSMKR
jgi:SAM-dependent methyltransferase